MSHSTNFTTFVNNINTLDLNTQHLSQNLEKIDKPKLGNFDRLIRFISPGSHLKGKLEIAQKISALITPENLSTLNESQRTTLQKKLETLAPKILSGLDAKRSIPVQFKEKIEMLVRNNMTLVGNNIQQAPFVAPAKTEVPKRSPPVIQKKKPTTKDIAPVVKKPTQPKAPVQQQPVPVRVKSFSEMLRDSFGEKACRILANRYSSIVAAEVVDHFNERILRGEKIPSKEIGALAKKLQADITKKAEAANTASTQQKISAAMAIKSFGKVVYGNLVRNYTPKILDQVKETFRQNIISGLSIASNEVLGEANLQVLNAIKGYPDFIQDQALSAAFSRRVTDELKTQFVLGDFYLRQKDAVSELLKLCELYQIADALNKDVILVVAEQCGYAVGNQVILHFRDRIKNGEHIPQNEVLRKAVELKKKELNAGSGAA